MFVKMAKDHQGNKAGDIVRFEDTREGLALVKQDLGVEVRRNKEGEWVPVNRVEISVTDGAQSKDGA